MTETLPLSEIRLDGGTQHRVEEDGTKVDEYAQALLAGEKLPPVLVFDDDEHYWLAGGHHRYHAHKQAAKIDPAFAEIEIDLHHGTQRDAIIASFAENATHGMPRTRSDRRRIVLKMLEDPELSQESDRKLGEIANIRHEYVSEVRGELRHLLEAQQTQATRKVQRGGQSYTMNVTAIGRRPAGVREREDKSRSVVVAEALNTIDTAMYNLPQPQEVAAGGHHFDIDRATFIGMWWSKYAAHKRQLIERAS